MDTNKVFGVCVGGVAVMALLCVCVVVGECSTTPSKAEATTPEVEANSGWTREIIKLGTGMNSEWVTVITSPDGARFVHGNSNITLTPYPKVVK